MCGPRKIFEQFDGRAAQLNWIFEVRTIEVLKHGSTKKQSHFFVCKSCQCEFIAENSFDSGIEEYEVCYNEFGDSYLKTKCPECHRTVYSN